MNKNDIYSGFILQETSALAEADSRAYLFEHQKSGARLLYLANKDDNKVFSVSFRTPPPDDSGLPHILEHSVLCGSRKYPLKEPFVELVKGSLNTFLNAMTFADKTMYPVASRNDKDFRNLMDVYLDAVFFPNIYGNPYIMQQEGWHYELLDEHAPLEYKGVVYNEMKGMYSSPDVLLENKVMKALFPDSPYGFESGGLPEAVPELTQADFEAFHREFYHPANSFIYLYGDLDINDTLTFLDKEYLASFDRINIDAPPAPQAAPARTRLVEGLYPLAAGENAEGKTFLSWSAVVGDALDAERNFAFQLLEHYLLETDASPLRKALLEAGVGKEISGSFTRCLRQPVFTVTVSGARPENRDKFISVLYRTLQRITIDGLDKELFAASLNRLEFLLREADFGSYPKGLFYAMNCMDSWLYGGDPLAYLSYERLLHSLRDKLSARYYESLIEGWLLDNTHRAVVMLQPRAGLAEERQAVLRDRLTAIKNSFTPQEMASCIQDTRRLLARQSEPDSSELLAKIPLLARGDLKKQAEWPDYHLEERAGSTLLYLPRPTNKIAYINLHFDARALPAELLPYAHLLCDLSGRLSTAKYSEEDLARLSNTHTGGLSFAFRTFSHHSDADLYQPKFLVAGKVLISKLAYLTDLIGEILTGTLYTDHKRLLALTAELKADWDASFFARGQTIVLARLLSYFSHAGKYAEQGYLSYYRFLSGLDKADAAAVAEKLARTARILFTRNNILAAYCCEAGDQPAVRGEILKQAAALADAPADALPAELPDTGKNEGIATPAQVQYVAAGGNFARHGFTYNGALKVLENIMRYDYLWNRLRVKGGAYGANARFDFNGNTTFNSYRDPNLAETLTTFREIPGYIAEFAPDEREMLKYVIGTVSQLDRPLTPSLQLERAAEYYLRDITRDILQAERDDIINCSAADIRALQPLAQAALSGGHLCVLGSESKLRDNRDVFAHIVNAVN